MSSRFRGALVALLAVELALGLCAMAWRLSRAAPPPVNLGRLPASTAADIRRLQQRVVTDRPAAWLELGEAYLAYGYFPPAEACLKRAAMLTPRSFAALYAHAYSLDRLGRLPEAEAQFRAAAALTKDEAASNCWYHIGLSHLRREDAQQAEQAFVRAGERYAPAVHARARLLIRSRKSSEALVLIAALRHELSLDIQTEMLAVRAFRELNDSVEMNRAAERAERSTERLRLSDHWEYLHPIRCRYGLMARSAQARAMAEQGNFDAAAQTLKSVLDSESPNDTEGMSEQGARLCMIAGQGNAAIGILTRFQQRMSLPPSAMHLLGDALASAGRIQDAVPMWEAANRRRPDDQSYRQLSAVHAQMNHESQAARDLGWAALIAGMGAYRANQLPVAGQELETARRILKDDARPAFYLGEIAWGSSKIDQARTAYRRCIELDPDHGRALERLEQLPK